MKMRHYFALFIAKPGVHLRFLIFWANITLFRGKPGFFCHFRENGSIERQIKQWYIVVCDVSFAVKSNKNTGWNLATPIWLNLFEPLYDMYAVGIGTRLIRCRVVFQVLTARKKPTWFYWKSSLFLRGDETNIRFIQICFPFDRKRNWSYKIAERIRRHETTLTSIIGSLKHLRSRALNVRITIMSMIMRNLFSRPDLRFVVL